MNLEEIKQINEMKEINKPRETSQLFALKQIKDKLNKTLQSNPPKMKTKEE